MNRRTALIALATSGMLAGLAAPTVSASPAAPSLPTGFTEGTWTGTMSLSGHVEVPDYGTGVTTGIGDFVLDVLPGSVSGTFSYDWRTDYHITVADMPDDLRDGVGTAYASGTIVAGDGGPTLQSDVLVVMDISYDPAYTVHPVLAVSSAGCTMVTGDWRAAFLDGAASVGVMTAGVDGSFVAHRDGTVPADVLEQFQQDSRALVTEMAQLRDAILGGDTSQISQLAPLLDRVEALGRDRHVDESCPSAGRTEVDVLPMVDELLRMYTTGELVLPSAAVNQLVLASLRAGVIGAAALDPVRSQDRLTALRAALLRDMAVPASEADRRALGRTARLLGMDDVFFLSIIQ